MDMSSSGNNSAEDNSISISSEIANKRKEPDNKNNAADNQQNKKQNSSSTATFHTKFKSLPSFLPLQYQRSTVTDKILLSGRVDARDKYGKWLPATIISINKNHIKVHYDGWESKWDEQLTPSVDFYRLAPIGTYSGQRLKDQYSPFWFKDNCAVGIYYLDKPFIRGWVKGVVTEIATDNHFLVTMRINESTYQYWIHLGSDEFVFMENVIRYGGWCLNCSVNIFDLEKLSWVKGRVEKIIPDSDKADTPVLSVVVKSNDLRVVIDLERIERWNLSDQNDKIINQGKNDKSDDHSLHNNEKEKYQKNDNLRLECPVCLHSYTSASKWHKPRLFSCGHMICSLCLKTLLLRMHLSCPIW